MVKPGVTLGGCLGLALFAALSACDKGDGNSAGSSCRAMCDWKGRCTRLESGETVETCTSTCESTSCTTQRADVTQAYVRCFADLECSASDDDCGNDAILAVYPSVEAAQNDPDYVTCIDKHAACDTAGGATFLDDDCSQVLAFAEGDKASFRSCMQKDCAEIASCLDAVCRPAT